MRTRLKSYELNRNDSPNVLDLVSAGPHPSSVKRPSPYTPSVRYSLRLQESKSLSDFPLSNEEHPEVSQTKKSRRIPYTDIDDWTILNYIITNNLVEKIRSHAIWATMETACLTSHSAESMRSRFLHSIMHHFHEVLHSTPEGRLKYNNPESINTLYRRFAAVSKNILGRDDHTKDLESPANTSDLSYFTSDNSVHDGDTDINHPALLQSPSEEPVKLVDYEDTQSQRIQESQDDVSPEVPSSFNTTAKPRRRLSLSLNNSPPRSRGLRTRHLTFVSNGISRRILRSRTIKLHEVINVDTSEVEHDQSARALSTSASSEILAVSLSNQTVGLAVSKCTTTSRLSVNSQQGLLESDSAPAYAKTGFYTQSVARSHNLSPNKQSRSPAINRLKRISKGLHRKNIKSVDLDVSHSPSKELVHSRELLEEDGSLEIIPDTTSETSQSHLSGSLSLDHIEPGKEGSNISEFPFGGTRSETNMCQILAEATKFTRTLDSFAHRHRLSCTDAALLLHLTSGDVDVADLVATGKSTSSSLWFPSDDARLLSLSPTDLDAVCQKFGPKEVSRRLMPVSRRRRRRFQGVESASSAVATKRDFIEAGPHISTCSETSASPNDPLLLNQRQAAATSLMPVPSPALLRPGHQPGVWPLRERLLLASALLDTDNQQLTWPPISRRLAKFTPPNRFGFTRPPTWCSARACAKQYSLLLDSAEMFRKQQVDVEKSAEEGRVVFQAPSDVAAATATVGLSLAEFIVKRLTVERVEELRNQIIFTRQKYRLFKEMLSKVENGDLDHCMDTLWASIQRQQEEHSSSDAVDFPADTPLEVVEFVGELNAWTDPFDVPQSVWTVSGSGGAVLRNMPPIAKVTSPRKVAPSVCKSKPPSERRTSTSNRDSAAEIAEGEGEGDGSGERSSTPSTSVMSESDLEYGDDTLKAESCYSDKPERKEGQEEEEAEAVVEEEEEKKSGTVEVEEKSEAMEVEEKEEVVEEKKEKEEEMVEKEEEKEKATLPPLIVDSPKTKLEIASPQPFKSSPMVDSATVLSPPRPAKEEVSDDSSAMQECDNQQKSETGKDDTFQPRSLRLRLSRQGDGNLSVVPEYPPVSPPPPPPPTFPLRLRLSLHRNTQFVKAPRGQWSADVLKEVFPSVKPEVTVLPRKRRRSSGYVTDAEVFEAAKSVLAVAEERACEAAHDGKSTQRKVFVHSVLSQLAAAVYATSTSAQRKDGKVISVNVAKEVYARLASILQRFELESAVETESGRPDAKKPPRGK